MEILKLNRGEAEKAMNEWIDSYPALPQINSDYIALRHDLKTLFQKLADEWNITNIKTQEYEADVKFGMLLYMYLKKQEWFSVRLAADDGFWRYLSLRVVPDIVAARWGKDNDSHYWSTPGRIWLKQLWWYIHLSWKDDDSTTRKIVESPNCSTDTILNFVERSGKKGTCVEAYRWIIYFYSLVPADALSEYNRQGKNHNLLRVVMKLNTARMMMTEPALCIGGCKGYAKKLFVDAGFDFDLIKE